MLKGGLLLVLLLLILSLSARLLAEVPALPDWQALALREQQNATLDKMVANGMIAALQSEIADLKARIAKQDPPPGDRGSGPLGTAPEPAK